MFESKFPEVESLVPRFLFRKACSRVTSPAWFFRPYFMYVLNSAGHEAVSPSIGAMIVSEIDSPSPGSGLEDRMK